MSAGRMTKYKAYVGLRDVGKPNQHWEPFLCGKDIHACAYCAGIYQAVIPCRDWEHANHVSATIDPEWRRRAVRA